MTDLAAIDRPQIARTGLGRLFEGQTAIDFVGRRKIGLVISLVLLAATALIVPIAVSEMVRSDRATAQEQCRRIAVALELFVKESGGEPTDPISKKKVHWMKGPGVNPTNNSFNDGGPTCALGQVLQVKHPAVKNWSEPFLPEITPDPWGSAYLVNTHGFFESAERVWILCAGPNGIVETPPESDETWGDDIGRLIE